MFRICIFNRKGGCAKTTTCAALAAGLHRKGNKVLIVDLDSQYNLTSLLSADPNKPGAMAALMGENPIQECIQRTKCGDLLGGSASLAAADMLITGDQKEYRLRELLESVNDQYEYCVIDCPGSLGILTINALTAAYQAVIPAEPASFSLESLAQLKQLIDTVKKRSKSYVYLDGILITRYDSRTKLSKDMKATLEAAAEYLGTRVYTQPIRNCVAIGEAQAVQEDIFTYAPRSNGAKDYQSFIDELLEGIV